MYEKAKCYSKLIYHFRLRNPQHGVSNSIFYPETTRRESWSEAFVLRPTSASADDFTIGHLVTLNTQPVLSQQLSQISQVQFVFIPQRSLVVSSGEKDKNVPLEATAFTFYFDGEPELSLETSHQSCSQSTHFRCKGLPNVIVHLCNLFMANNLL